MAKTWGRFAELTLWGLQIGPHAYCLSTSWRPNQRKNQGQSALIGQWLTISELFRSGQPCKHAKDGTLTSQEFGSHCTPRTMLFGRPCLSSVFPANYLEESICPDPKHHHAFFVPSDVLEFTMNSVIFHLVGKILCIRRPGDPNGKVSWNCFSVIILLRCPGIKQGGRQRKEGYRKAEARRCSAGSSGKRHSAVTVQLNSLGSDKVPCLPRHPWRHKRHLHRDKLIEMAVI